MTKKGKKIKEVNCSGKEKQLQENAQKSLCKYLMEPSVQLGYQYAIDLVTARLRLIDAELTKQRERQIIRSLSWRIKSCESIIKKLKKKQRKISYQTAVDTLNDIAGVRVVCYFCDDIFAVADYVKRQADFTLIKEKNYIATPKSSGYQSLHLIIGVPLTYLEKTWEVRVEIQIRSFAMDYWAELDNQMCYKKTAGQIEAVKRETRTHSSVIAEVDSQMLKLRERVKPLGE